jgi:hypothetical protein
MIIEKLGSDKITLFDMSEILRAAIHYVDPANANKEEVVDPKAKGGKGKVEAAPVDPYEGLDTTAYKEIST